jgi:hypothetical protein
MAQIRFVDDWLRSPAAPPSHWRSVMVIAEKWAEQRVLMRAYAESRDQTRPTITLHGAELAIGPAGIDVNGPWGIHVGEGPEGRAQEIKSHFESSARRLAGSKGNPPRLLDEEATFDREPTANWGPGAPRILPQRTDMRSTPVEYASSTPATRIPQAQAATYIPSASAQNYPAPAEEFAAPTNPDVRTTPVRSRGRTRPPPNPSSSSARTNLGYTSGAGAQSAVVRLGLAPGVSARLGRFVDRVVPTDFQIDSGERRVLNALGETGALTARAIGQMLDIVDAVSFMEELTRKLESFNLDLIEPADPEGGEPTYKLRR